MIRSLILACVFWFVFSVFNGYSQPINLKINRIIDGDTYYGTDSLEKQYKIRLKDVDCPEMKQKYGKNAKEFAEKMVLGSWVRVEFAGSDKYKRTLAWVFLPDQTVLNELLVRRGWAWPYESKNLKPSKRLEMLKEKAKNEKIGLWQEQNPIPPWEFRSKKK